MQIIVSLGLAGNGVAGREWRGLLKGIEFLTEVVKMCQN